VMPFRISERSRSDELMDDLSLDKEALKLALTELAFLNRLSLAPAPFVNSIVDLVHVHSLNKVSVCDIACGSGDVLCGVIKGLSRRGLSATGLGLDFNPHSLELGFARAQADGAPDNPVPCKFEVQDVLHGIKGQPADIYICSLFLHHLSATQVVDLLRDMRTRARIGIVVTDLVRSPLGLAAAWFSTRVFCSSPIVRNDAIRSVEAAFTIEEIAKLASSAGLDGCKISRVWPERFRLVWRNP